VNGTTILLSTAEDDCATRGGSVFQLIKDESGVTAIEYGLIASLIAVAAIAAFTAVGTNISNLFSTVATNL